MFFSRAACSSAVGRGMHLLNSCGSYLMVSIMAASFSQHEGELESLDLYAPLPTDADVLAVEISSARSRQLWLNAGHRSVGYATSYSCALRRRFPRACSLYVRP